MNSMKSSRFLRAGLTIYRLTTIAANSVDPADSADLVRMIKAATPEARLVRIRDRAAAHSEVEGLPGEIGEAAELLATADQWRACHFALLALERGLDLLDTGRYMQPILRDQAMQAGRALAGRNRSRKLPLPHELESELQALMSARHITEGQARAVLADRHHVTRQAVGKQLKKAKPS